MMRPYVVVLTYPDRRKPEAVECRDMWAVRINVAAHAGLGIHITVWERSDDRCTRIDALSSPRVTT